MQEYNKYMKNRVVLIALSVLMFCAAIGITVYFFWANGYMKPATEPAPTASYDTITYPSFESDTIENIVNTDQTDETSPEETIPTVDFESLQAANPDIIGWIYMENPAISLPILRSPTDDTYYLYHDPEGNYSKSGSLFVEHEYNSADFSDPCTVIYGHRMSDGGMFGILQGVCQEETYFDEPQYIVIFTPNGQKVSQIFAIACTDKEHILLENDFTDPDEYNAFIDSIYADNTIGYTQLEDLKPTSDDNILILSTCLWGDRFQRFLVLAVEI